jgi:hypothetical protein
MRVFINIILVVLSLFLLSLLPIQVWSAGAACHYSNMMPTSKCHADSYWPYFVCSVLGTISAIVLTVGFNRRIGAVYLVMAAAALALFGTAAAFGALMLFAGAMLGALATA